MAILLGVGEVVLEQARSPALEGGGDLVVSGAAGRVDSARFVISQLSDRSSFGARVRALSPSRFATLYLLHGETSTAVRARGGIPSMERALEDPETSAVEAWIDGPGDREWSDPDPARVLREMDRFHPVPDVDAWSGSWAEWLYFNGSAAGARFYLSFLYGGPDENGNRPAGVRLQLDRDGQRKSYVDRATVPEDELLGRAPDVSIGESRVRLEGLRYTIDLALYEEGPESPGMSASGRTAAPDVTGTIVLEAVPGRSIPPFTLYGARGWRSGYVVPVLSGRLNGTLSVDGETISLEEGTGYHDHNWGFWEGVTWQWGQVADEDLSLVYGRVRPPVTAADPDRTPGFLAVLGPDGPLGLSTDVAIEEEDNDESGTPRRILVRARGETLDVTLRLSVEDAIRTGIADSPLAAGAGDLEFLQMSAVFEVSGRVGDRQIEFRSRGAAETFRGR
jgi:hypothetical protein